MTKMVTKDVIKFMTNMLDKLFEDYDIGFSENEPKSRYKFDDNFVINVQPQGITLLVSFVYEYKEKEHSTKARLAMAKVIRIRNEDYECGHAVHTYVETHQEYAFRKDPDAIKKREDQMIQVINNAIDQALSTTKMDYQRQTALNVDRTSGLTQVLRRIENAKN